jgi:hypothetical protein
MGFHGHLTVYNDTKIAGSRNWFDLVHIDMKVTVWYVPATPWWAAPDKLRLLSCSAAIDDIASTGRFLERSSTLDVCILCFIYEQGSKLVSQNND